jgi:hypothetical protein
VGKAVTSILSNPKALLVLMGLVRPTGRANWVAIDTALTFGEGSEKNDPARNVGRKEH